MEFSEIGEKFEGLNADQVYNLAKVRQGDFRNKRLCNIGKDVYLKLFLHSWMITTTEKPDALS